MTLQGLTGSESLTGHSCLGFLINRETELEDGKKNYIIECLPPGTDMFGSLNCST